MMSTSVKPAERKRTGIWRLVGGNMLVLAVLLLLIFCAGEIYYRYFFDSTDSFALTLVTRRWFERHYLVNHVPVRDNIEYSLKPAPGMKRISFLGDSFTAGHGVADVEMRFANILRKARGSAQEVHALAECGLDTGAEIAKLRLFFGKGYQTDVVVLVYILNDISDLIPGWQAKQRRIYSDVENANFLVHQSYFINKLYYQVKVARDPDLAGFFSFVREAYDGPLWEQQKDRLRSLMELCKSRNTGFMVVTFPFLQALGPDYTFAPVHEKLGAFWKENGVPHLDLLSVYKSYEPGQLVVGKYDAHPNEFAHKRAAAAIDLFLEQEMK